MNQDIPHLVKDLIHNPEPSTHTINQLDGKNEQDVALLLESLPVSDRLTTWESIGDSNKAAILVAMRNDPRMPILGAMHQEALTHLLSQLDAEQLLDLSSSLPDQIVERALNEMDAKQQSLYQSLAEFSDSQIGHWRSSTLLSLPITAKVSDLQALLKRKTQHINDSVYLTDKRGKYVGMVILSQGLARPSDTPLIDLLNENISELKSIDDAHTGARQVQQSGLSSLPVIDDNDKLIGRLDSATAYYLLETYHEHQLMASAGLKEDEDLFAPVKKSAQKRAVWLGINLLTAFLASWFIGLFEATLQQVVALAVLMPVVASMGGITGSQSLTLLIRGLALGQVTKANFRVLLKKEFQVGALNGVIWAIVIAVVAGLWFSSIGIGLVIGAAIFVNIVAAAVTGVLLPALLDKLRLDPALSGSVILTTVTDIVGFVAFLGLGSLFLV